MNVAREDTGLELTISHEPVEVDNPCQVYKDTIPEELLEAVCNFYRNNNRMSGGNYTIITRDSLQRVLSAGCYCGILTINQEILGCMMTLPLSISYNDQEFKSSYTTHLCIKRDKRKQGHAMTLIKNIMNSGYQDGIVHGYYLTTSGNHTCGVSVGSWYRPTAPNKAKAAGFTVPKISTMKQRALYRSTSVNGVSRSKNKDRQLRQIHQWSDSKIKFTPTVQEWNNLCTGYDVWTITVRGQDAAVAILNHFPIIDGNTGVETMVTTLCYLIVEPSMVHCISGVMVEISIIAQSHDSCVVYGHSIGTLYDRRVRSVCGLVDTSNQKVLEFYNSSLSLETKDVHLPLL